MRRFVAVVLGALMVLPTLPMTASAAAAPADPTDTHYQIGVLVLEYFPLTADGQYIDINVTGDVGGLYSDVKANVESMTAALPGLLSEGTRYQGYANATAQPSLTYSIVGTIERDTPVPAVPSTFNPAYPYRADYPTIFNGLNICNYVEHQGVKEVWIWAYQGPHQLDISESKMSGPYGDISNSYRLNDLPKCDRTYTVYTFNYGRSVALAVHSYGHQLEAELSYLDPHLFNDLFEGPNYPQTLGVVGRCGSVHNPPNARTEYDWANPTPNPSDCNAWDPNGLGATTEVSCAQWTCVDLGNDDPQLKYLIWWMQHFPGRGNRIRYQGRPMRNWWDVHGDFDAVAALHAGLTLTVTRIDSAAFGDLAGYSNDRYGTAAAVAEGAFPAGAAVVYVATGTNFPDALGASAAAAKAGGPVLLVTPTAIPPATAHELTALHPTAIYIAGGTGAVSLAVQAALGGYIWP
jgi:Cell wall binding domain 2 (CWB2)